MGSQELKKTEEITEKDYLGDKSNNSSLEHKGKIVQGIEALDLAWKDGMKTQEEIKGYDPIANPTNDVLSGKQGVGTSSLTDPYGYYRGE